MALLKKHKIGIDLGGTSIKVGIVNAENKLLGTHSCPTYANRDCEAVIEDMSNAVKFVLSELKLSEDDCICIGVGCPGITDSDKGELVYASNFPTWKRAPIKAELSKRFNLPVFIENDATCATIGEFVDGAAKNVQSVVMITLGTGVGSGIVMDGKIFTAGFGGLEIGHSSLVFGGEPCSCGRHGCFEAYCSATALIRDAKIAATEHPDSQLNILCDGVLENITAKMVFDANDGGDLVASALCNRYIAMLGVGLVDVVNIFRPQLILLGGGVSKQGKFLTEPLNAYISEYSYASSLMTAPKVEIATLGNDAGIIGAANLIDFVNLI